MMFFVVALGIYIVGVPFGIIKPSKADEEFTDANGNKIVFRKR